VGGGKIIQLIVRVFGAKPAFYSNSSVKLIHQYTFFSFNSRHYHRAATIAKNIHRRAHHIQNTIGHH
jgi:hypothetical protein